MFDVRGRLLYFITQSVEESVVYYRVRHTFHTLSDRTCASEVRKRISMCMSVQSLLQNPQQPWLSLACTPNKKKSVKVSAFFPHYHSGFKYMWNVKFEKHKKVSFFTDFRTSSTLSLATTRRKKSLLWMMSGS